MVGKEFALLTPSGNRYLYAGIFLISAATLLLELTLTRILDVLLWSNMAYVIVSSAIFGFGLGGIVLMLWPMADIDTDKLLVATSAGFASLVLLLIPALKWIPADFNDMSVHPVTQLLAFGGLYICLFAPFFASGLAISVMLTRHAERVHRLYFWDLTGAGIGCLGIFVLPSLIGAGETLFVIGGAGVIAALLFARKGSRVGPIGALAVVVLVAVTTGFSGHITFKSFVARDSWFGGSSNRVEFSRWDPIARIDILSLDTPFLKEILYDRAGQRSRFYSFNGNFEELRQHYFDVIDASDGRNRYNNGKYVALAHWLKQNSSPRTLSIGSAGGQEILAALAWGARHVDAVEMVCTVIDAGKGPYAEFIGHLFTDPRVNVWCDEGRSFLRHSTDKYDIIQLHSNHTIASLANGSGGLTPVHLHTVEAYKEYFARLTRDGILQVNYFVYPRLITTAAKAWSELFPAEDFKRHVLITSGLPTMSTFLVKRSEWTPDEIAGVRRFLSPEFPDGRTYRIIYAPAEPESINVPNEFFAVPLNPKFEAALPYKVFPPTDDRPFFRDLRKDARWMEPDKEGYVPAETASFMNASLSRTFGAKENLHLYVLGGISVVFALVMIAVPLLLFQRKGLGRPETAPALIYFACLGAGFIIVELVLMMKFVLLIGFPIYAMAAVLFTLLASAGVGSYLSERLSRSWGRRTILIIPAFGLIAVLLIIAFPSLRDLTLGMDRPSRILLVMASIIPIGIPLGMPFPLGIQALHSRAPNLIPWAWGVNGFMTIVGSLLAVILSMKIGFDATLLVAVGIYVVALLSFLMLSRGRRSSEPGSGP